MPIRRWLLFVHRWLGLLTSLFLAVAGTTGAVLVWPSDSALNRLAGRLHVSLAAGGMGRRVVLIATALAVIMQVTGIYLWWRRKQIGIRLHRGWLKALEDLHHAFGAVGLVLMLLLAASGAVRPFVKSPSIRPTVTALHTARGYSFPIKSLYTAASMGFLIQGVAGVTMWWSARRRAG